VTLLLVALAGILAGGAIALRRQGRPLLVVILTAALSALLLAVAVDRGAFG
jgi:hypothetical protein